MGTTTEDVHESSMEARLSRVGAAIDRLIARVEGVAGKVGSRFDRIVTGLRSEFEEARKRVREMRQADKAARITYEEAVDQAVARMEAEVAIAEAQLDADLARSHKSFVAAVESEIEGWRARIDDLRVRADLAEAEVRDRLVPLLDRVEVRRAAVLARVDEVRDDTTAAWSALRTGVGEAMDLLREAVEEASRELGNE